MIEPYYQDEAVTLYWGDCMTVMPMLPITVDCVVADPPYGTTRNQWDRELPNKLLWHCYHQLCGPRTPIVVFGTGSFTARLVVSNIGEFKYTIIWDKQTVSGHLNAKKQPLRAHEDINVFYGAQPVYHPQMEYTGRKSHGRGKNTERTINHWGGFDNTDVVEQDGYQYPRSIIAIPRPKLPRGVGHPNQKPVELAEWLIRTFTDEGQLVLDNVAGSGTTLVAARNLGRRAVGIEAREDYCEMIATRLASGAAGDRW